MVINVQFQNLSQANSEILKAFNSSSSAKALEAYQPLDAKQRKLEKLRALQILQQSSESETLGNIALSTTSLSMALQKAEGATLQAMLNLLSAKMIEQNKFTYYDENQQIDLKKKIQEKLEERVEAKDPDQEKKKDQKKKQESKKKPTEDKAIDKLVNAAVTYFKEIQESIIEAYKDILSAVSLENLRKVLKEGMGFIVKYSYEVPQELFKEMVIEPINEFRANIDRYIKNATSKNLRKTNSSFSPNEIKTLLKKSFKTTKDDIKLKRSIEVLNNQSLVVKKKIQTGPRLKVSSQDIRLALHR